MNRYQSANPRAAAGIAALAMTALVIGISVVLPAKLDRSAQPALAATPAGETAATEVATLPAIHVVATREPRIAVKYSGQPPSRHNQSI